MEPELNELIVIEKLRLELVGGSGIKLGGTLESHAAQLELKKWLERLHGSILQKKLTSFKVDVRQLNFVNSSSIRLFVDWIARAETAAYKLVFLIERGITWHRLSFSVLQSLAPNCVEIQEGIASEAPRGRRSSGSRHVARK